jgi:hypothetical protein
MQEASYYSDTWMNVAWVSRCFGGRALSVTAHFTVHFLPETFIIPHVQCRYVWQCLSLSQYCHWNTVRSREIQYVASGTPVNVFDWADPDQSVTRARSENIWSTCVSILRKVRHKPTTTWSVFIRTLAGLQILLRPVERKGMPWALIKYDLQCKKAITEKFVR